eukprot:UN07208
MLTYSLLQFKLRH